MMPWHPQRNRAVMLLLVKCYDKNKGLGVFCLFNSPLARHLVPNPQKKKKKTFLQPQSFPPFE